MSIHAHMPGTTSALFSHTSKLNCASFGLPAGKSCPRGSELSKCPGSVCSMCYASEDAIGRYQTGVVQVCQAARFAFSKTDDFVPTVIRELASSRATRFRWHDSGDIYSLDYGRKLVEIAKALPRITFWTPTHQPATAKALLDEGAPDNFLLRVSADYLDLPADDVPAGALACAVATTLERAKELGMPCPATFHLPGHENGECGSCTACFSRKVGCTVYKLHATKRRRK
jgi:hypothetical protein